LLAIFYVGYMTFEIASVAYGKLEVSRHWSIDHKTVIRWRGNYSRDTAKIGIRTPVKSEIYFRFVTETIVMVMSLTTW